MDFEHSQRAQPYIAALDRGLREPLPLNRSALPNRCAAIAHAHASTLTAASTIDASAVFGVLNELAAIQVGAPNVRRTVLDAAIPT
jgi:hypothetical protein